MRAADDEHPGRVDVQDQVVVDEGIGHDSRQDVLADIVFDRLERDVGVMLRRDHNRVNALDGSVVVLILDGDLALGVRPEVLHVLAALAELRQSLDQSVGESTSARGISVSSSSRVA